MKKPIVVVLLAALGGLRVLFAEEPDLGVFTPASVQAALDALHAGEVVLPAELQVAGGDPSALHAFAKKALVLENPLFRDKSILYVERRQYPRDHHNTGTMFQKGEVNQGSFHKVKGAALRRISLSDGVVTTLLETEEGMIRDPELDFAGEKILFSYRKNFDDDYHIYEMGVEGSDLKQLTSLAGVSDIDPFYLSDGRIVFSSTREPKFCACNRHIMANLFRMEADGANIVQIGKSIEFEGHGTQMPDGRILYNRWEYIDRNFGGAQGLWTANPDGTNHALYMWQSTPHPILNARPIPGSSHVLGILSSCHDRPWGALALLDRSKGVEGKEPVLRTWPVKARDMIADEAKNYAGGGGFDIFTRLPVKYEDPLPLSKEVFLVSRSMGPVQREKVGIFMVDLFGNELLLHSAEGGRGCFDPLVLQPSPRPAVLADKTNFAKTNGTFLVMNVYEGTHMKGVKPGSVRYLRVVDNPPKMTWTRSAYVGQGSQAPAMNFHDFDNKRVLGTVPVEEDGSVQFTVPIDKFVYFQLLDEEQKMIQSMRSGIVAMPGENNACIGCHDDRNSAPLRPSGSLAALRKGPVRIDESTAETKGNFSYQEEVQPIFDRNCVSCHDYGQEAGESLNLSGDKTAMFAVSYLELHQKKLIAPVGGGPNKIYGAYEWGSKQSKLIEVLEAEHPACSGTVSREELLTLIKWIDLNAPYYPDYSSAYVAFPGGRCPLTQPELNEIGRLSGHKFSHFAWNRPYMLNFDRPEHSPVLQLVSEELAKAQIIGIIRQGAERLEQTPRNDMPGYQPHPEDARRLARYQQLFERELANRRAFQQGTERVYDN